MFIEPHIKKGWIEVICGSMFSGKTEELIRRLRRAKFANQSILIFKPAIDTRYDKTNIVSHDATSIPSIPIQHSSQILENAIGKDVVGIDEAQFFDDQLPEVCQQLALNGCRVIVAGLDMDFQGKPFGGIPHLLAVAEYITKLHAICMKCGHLATHSFRKTTNQAKIALGEKEIYEARCRVCYTEGIEEQNAEVIPLKASSVTAIK